MTQTVSITIQAGRRGDPEVHLGGCAHLSRLPFRPGEAWGTPVSHVGEGARYATALLAAIVDADTDLAAMFGQTAYEPDNDDVPWCIAGGIEWAPCFGDAVKAAGIVFEPAPGGFDREGNERGGTGRPSLPGEVDETTNKGVDKSTEAPVVSGNRAGGTGTESRGEPGEGEPEMTTAARKMTRKERFTSGQAIVAAGIAGILAGETTADAVLADVAEVVPETVVVTEAAKPKRTRKVVAAETPEPDPIVETVEAPVSLITIETRDAVLAGGDAALIAAVEAGTYVRPNGKAPGGSVKAPSGPARYPRWRLAIEVPAGSTVETVEPDAEWGWTSPDGPRAPRAPRTVTVTEKAAKAPRLASPETIARRSKAAAAKALLTEVDALSGAEMLAAVGTREVQDALETAAIASLGRDADDE